jgi:hypothetical protein
MKVLCICMVLVCGLGFTSAWAEEKTSRKPLDMRYTIYGGAQFYQADGKFGYIKEGQPDIKVDLDDLGLDETAVSPIVGAIINFWDNRLTLRLDYFGYHDDATETADFSFDFDDVHYPLGASLDSSLDLDVYVANLSYNFIRTQRARLGVGVGVHAANIDLKISGKANVLGTVVDLGSGEADLLAPLPNIYVMGAYAFTDRFLIRGGGGGMSLTYGDWDGSLWFVNAFLEYWPWRHVGFGAGYRYLDVDVDYDPGHKKETYDFTLPGPVVYLTAGF